MTNITKCSLQNMLHNDPIQQHIMKNQTLLALVSYGILTQWSSWVSIFFCFDWVFIAYNWRCFLLFPEEWEAFESWIEFFFSVAFNDRCILIVRCLERNIFSSCQMWKKKYPNYIVSMRIFGIIVDANINKVKMIACIQYSIESKPYLAWLVYGCWWTKTDK